MRSINCTISCLPLQDERNVEPAGEAAQPHEAHHPEDGDHLRGRRVRRPRQRQGQHVAKCETGQPKKTRVSVGPTDEGHRGPKKMKRMR